jgi:hypothetical protein
MLATVGSADALIQYTSGTVGRPKGATFTREAVPPPRRHGGRRHRIPSAEWGEDIVAVVVLRPGERATAEELVLRSRYATPAT